ncbi:MAG: type I DNA topoisomerase [Planctomycetota bacterium]
MPKSLVIVESPAKARTINRYLGKDFVVRASMGHVRDLPKGKFAIDIDDNFTPEYVAIRGKGKILAELRKHARPAEHIYIATDCDREGEAIAWHLCEALKLPGKKVSRVTFNEITKKAIKEAFKSPHHIDINMVNAQQARRVLDRIVGYRLSPLLWKKISKGLSAGRVQSVAVMLIVEREKEIRKFTQEEYWKITAKLIADEDADAEKESFTAELRKINGANIDLKNEESTTRAVSEIQNEKFVIEKVERKKRTEHPRPPFITSTLQQQASTQLGFSAKKTMYLAQQLYEGVELGSEGQVALITYMRTDSVHLAESAVAATRDVIEKTFGEKYLPPEPKFYKSKKDAQGAHEAVRPTEPERHPDDVGKHLSPDLAKLYNLIWRRFIACQMNPALFNVNVADIRAGKYLFKASGREMIFDGHLRVIGLKNRAEQQILPELVEGREAFPVEIIPSQHFTQPPPRYTEATLVRVLEGKGIGRPSTYAPIISTIQDRGYVEQKQRKFHATPLGEIVTDKLVAHFPDIINTEFTSQMESNLDTVEEGKADWVTVLREFYNLFSADLEKAETKMTSEKGKTTESNIKCEKCGKPMVYRWSKRGRFLGCSGYPDCKNTKPLTDNGEVEEPEEIDEKCPECGAPMTVKTGRYGKFIACTMYPDCKHTSAYSPPGETPGEPGEEEKCPNCGAPMVLKRGRWGQFLACSKYPECKTTKKIAKGKAEGRGQKAEGTGGSRKAKSEVAPGEAGGDHDASQPAEKQEKEGVMKCDKCGAPMVEKMSRRGKFLGCSNYPACTNTMPISKAAPPEESDEKCPNCGAPMVIRSGRWGKFLACSAFPKCKTTKKLEG